MKKIIITIMVALCALTASAQSDKSYQQKGTTFVQVSTKSSRGSSAIKTKYTWQDSKGNIYPIYLSKNGKAFVKKTSKKTGKEYNQYLDTEISTKLAREYNIKSNN